MYSESSEFDSIIDDLKSKSLVLQSDHYGLGKKRLSNKEKDKLIDKFFYETSSKPSKESRRSIQKVLSNKNIVGDGYPFTETCSNCKIL